MTHIPMKAERLLHIRLTLQAFAEGGGAGAGATGGTGEGAPGPAAQGEGVRRPGETVSSEVPEADTSTAREAGETDTEKEAPPDYDREFEEFLKRPEMKARMDKRTQGAVKARFKSAEAEAQVTREISAILAERYGVDAADPTAIKAALEADDRIDTERAEEAGMSVETYRELARLRREAKAQTEREEAGRAAREAAALRMQAGKLAREYPGFDLDTEMADPQFKRLVDAGVDLRSAYITRHHRELFGSAVRHAERQATDRVTEVVRANKARPVEGGAGGGAPSSGGQDFANMSDAEFKALRERRRNGEKITFR